MIFHGITGSFIAENKRDSRSVPRNKLAFPGSATTSAHTYKIVHVK